MERQYSPVYFGGNHEAHNPNRYYLCSSCWQSCCPLAAAPATEQPAAPAGHRKAGGDACHQMYLPSRRHAADRSAWPRSRRSPSKPQDFSYSVPENVVEGWVRVNLTNSGSEPHHVQFLRLNDGVTFEQFQEALQARRRPGHGAGAAGGRCGRHRSDHVCRVRCSTCPPASMSCCDLIPSPSDNMPHFTKGMIANFPVLAAAG